MAIERARAQAVQKPWGVADLRPWNKSDHDGSRLVGEIWYERPGNAASDPSLLLKLLFTSQPLSIQVHPDDAYAQSIGLACGKTEAWYILSAAPGAKIALGLKKRLAPRQLREAVDDGSIAGLVAWRTVLSGDVVFVPAGTIHAIGAGLVIAEIQQRSDATFRMFDFGRKRELHVANAVAVADAAPADVSLKPKRLYGRTDASGIQPALRVRTDRTGAGLGGPPRCRARDLAARRRRHVPAPVSSTSPLATPFSHSRTASTFRLGPKAWPASWPTRVPAVRFRTCCSAPRSRASRMSHRWRVCRCGSRSFRTTASPTHGHTGSAAMNPLQRVAFIGNHLPAAAELRPSPMTYIERLRQRARIWRPASLP